MCAYVAHDALRVSVHDRHMDVEWLKAKKRELRVTDADLAPALGVERSVANKVANGKVALNARRADAVAKLLKVTRDEVLFRFGISTEPPTVDAGAQDDHEIEMVGIQYIDQTFGMGGRYSDSPVQIDVLRFPKVWVESITSTPATLLTWTEGRGDSMEPTIHDRDIILLDRSQRRVDEQDAIWAFTIGDVAAMKRLRVKGDRFVIISDNPSVPDDEEPIDFVNIIAKVILVAKRK